VSFWGFVPLGDGLRRGTSPVVRLEEVVLVVLSLKRVFDEWDEG